MKHLRLFALLLVCVPLASKPAVETPPMEWEALTRQPTRQLGTRVRVVGQWNGRVEQWNSYLTRFSSATHNGWQLWSDAQALWLREEYEAPRMRVFSPKGSALSQELSRLAPQQRVELELVVRECFMELPWAEVVGLRVLEESVSEATAFHAARAIELERKGAVQLALSELGSAMVPGLPAHFRSLLEALEAQWRDRHGVASGK